MAESSIISPTLLEYLKSGEKTTIVVKMSRTTEEALAKVDEYVARTGEDRGDAVSKLLLQLSEESQKEIRNFLDAQSPPVKYESLWIKNSLAVSDANLELVQQLASLSGISEIREEQTVTTMKSLIRPPKKTT